MSKPRARGAGEPRHPKLNRYAEPEAVAPTRRPTRGEPCFRDTDPDANDPGPIPGEPRSRRSAARRASRVRHRVSPRAETSGRRALAPLSHDALQLRAASIRVVGSAGRESAAGEHAACVWRAVRTRRNALGAWRAGQAWRACASCAPLPGALTAGACYGPSRPHLCLCAARDEHGGVSSDGPPWALLWRRCATASGSAERRGGAHFLKLELFFIWLRHAVKPVSIAPQPAQVKTAVFDLGSVSPSRLSRAQLPRSLIPLPLPPPPLLLLPRLPALADGRASFFLMPPPTGPPAAAAASAASLAFLTRSSGMGLLVTSLTLLVNN